MRTIARISFLFSLILFFSYCSNDYRAIYKVKFNVILNNPLENQKVFITGNQSELANWDPSKVQLEKISDSIYSITIGIPKDTQLEFKFTGGSWWLEALNCEGQLFDNFQMKVKKDTTFLITICDWKNTFLEDKVVLNQKRFYPNREYLIIDTLWKYHSGDNIEWSKENTNDSSWQKVSSYLKWDSNEYRNWNGIGWFRFHFIADTSLWNKSLALLIGQFGTSQLFYNGKHLYSFGEIGNTKNDFKPFQVRSWKEIKIDPKHDHVIAVRYANYNWKEQGRLGFSTGFVLFLKDINSIFTQISQNVREASNHQMIFSLIPLILFFLHLFIYIFNRNQNENLYYAICLLGFAGITYFNYEKFVEVDPSIIILYYQLNGLSVPVTIFFGLLTFFTIEYEKIPKRWIIYFLFFIGLSILNVFYPSDIAGTLNYFYFGILILELVASYFIKNGKKNPKGGWIIAVGFLILSFFVIIQVLLDFAVIQSLTSNQQVFGFGMIGFAISMSLFLSYNLSQLNKNLQFQLTTVQKLSAKAIEQERLAQEKELSRKLLEADNIRKTKELNDARNLQLSMLPLNIPDLAGFNIAVYMQPATEVGGDYYDFKWDKNDNLIVAVGDATGHGMKAGTMVTAIKALFTAESVVDLDVVSFLNQSNTVLRNMRIEGFFMAMLMVKICGNKATFSSAGMPPVLHFKKETNAVAEIKLRALPLGGASNYKYSKFETDIQSGDTLLLMSDGFPELFNDQKEMLDYNKSKEIFASIAHLKADTIIKYLCEEIDNWRGSAVQEDDITFVVIKVL